MAITLPYTFTAQTLARSSEVNANFDLLASRAADKTGDTLTGALFTQTLKPAVHSTYDLGTAALFYRTEYLRTSLVLGQSSGAYTITWANPATARSLSLEDPGGTDVFVYKAAAQVLTNKTLASPTFSGTYSLAGTPSIPAITGTVNVTGVGDNTGLTITATAIDRPLLTFSNATTGSLASLQGTNTKDLVLYTNVLASTALYAWASGGVSLAGDTTDPGAGNVRITNTLTALSTLQVGSSHARLIAGLAATTAPSGDIAAGSWGLTGSGPGFTIGNNSNGSGAAGYLGLYSAAGTPYYLWVDSTGDLRIGTAPPTANGAPADNSGVVVGGQS